MATELITELALVTSFIESQVNAGRPTESIIAGQASSLVGKIKAMPTLPLQDATLLTDAVQTGPFTAEQKAALTDAVAARLTTSDKKATVVGFHGQRGGQACVRFEHFLSVADVKALDSADGVNMKVFVVAERARKLGLFTPTEPTFGRMVAVIGARSYPAPPSASVLHELLQAMKRAVKQEDVRHGSAFGHAHLREYPFCAKELPAARLAHAYLAEDPPYGEWTDMDLHSIDAVQSVRYLRRTSNALRQQKTPTLDVHTRMDPNMMMMQSLASVLQPLFQAMQPQPQVDPSVRLMPLRPRQALPMPDAEAAVVAAAAPPQLALPAPLLLALPAPVPAPEGAGAADIGPLAEMRAETEASAAAAAAEGKANGRRPRGPAKRAVVKIMAKAAAAKAVAKPAKAAAGKCAVATKKRPAGAAKATSRGAFTSQAYDNTFRAQVRAGKTAPVAKEAARKAYQKAAAELDAM
jgi:hypothetical protein